MRKGTLSLIVASALSLGLGGCYIPTGYEIDGERIQIVEFSGKTVMTVQKKDRRKVCYQDFKSDGSVDRVEVTFWSKDRWVDFTYGGIFRSDDDKPILEQAQKDFDNYRKKIDEYSSRKKEEDRAKRIQHGLELIK